MPIAPYWSSGKLDLVLSPGDNREDRKSFQDSSRTADYGGLEIV
jgi:hypothetical protein